MAPYRLGLSETSHEIRERAAREAFEKLGPSPCEKAKVAAHRSNGHHLGSVYETDAGRVFHSVLTSRGRGCKDLPVSRHTGSDEGRDWLDLLDAGEDPTVPDQLQSGRACGPYQLSRALLVRQIKVSEKRAIAE